MRPFTRSFTSAGKSSLCANAVYDGTSAVMLSGESAMGRYPVESVRALASICEEAENNSEYSNLIPFLEENLPAPVDFRENS